MLMHINPAMPRYFSAGRMPPPDPSSPLGGLVPAGISEHRIAIVEDELLVAWSLETSVEEMGYQVTGIFSNADAVLASLRLHPVDLVLMDINLGGGMDGIEAARRIAAASSTRIIFISAYADLAVQERIRRSVPGALLLRKPVQLAELGDAIARSLAPPN